MSFRLRVSTLASRGITALTSRASSCASRPPHRGHGPSAVAATGSLRQRRSVTPHAFSPSTLGVAAPAAQLRSSSTGGGKKRDYYEVLGVARDASEKQIKAAYRKKAMETHPDVKGGDNAAFTEVSEAYDILSNGDKKRIYDQYGHEAAQQAAGPGGGFGGPGGMSAEDIFRNFFRGGGMGDGGFPGAGGGGGPMKVEDTDVKLTVTLEDLYMGATKSVSVTQTSVCTTCSGEGSKKKGQKQKCSQCNGSGREMIQHRMGPGMVQQMVTQCRKCHGSGSFLKQEDQCPSCRGQGVKPKSDTREVTLPQGAAGGMVLVMEGQGGQAPDAIPGDLNIHLEQLPHPVFTRRGDDLIVVHNASLIEALTGVESKLSLLDGRQIVFKSDPANVLKPDSVLAFPGEGMPLANGSGRGTLYVHIKINMPSTLTAQQKQDLEKILGAPRREKSANPGSVLHGKTLRESFQQLEQSRASAWSERAGGRATRGGRRGGQSGGPEGVQCAQQ